MQLKQSVCCCVTQEGLTPLHIAAKTGNAEMVRYLVLSGADIDEYNKVCQSAQSHVPPAL